MQAQDGATEAETEAVDLAHVAYFRADFQPVTAQNVWAYFRSSPFYDFSCLNEYIAMQGADESKLQTEIGVFYKVFPKDEGVFAIIKYRRDLVGTRLQVTCRDCYYVYGGRIFMAPTIMAVLEKKIRNVAYQLTEALIHADRFVKFDLPKGYKWQVDESTTSSEQKMPSKPSAVVHSASASFLKYLRELECEPSHTTSPRPSAVAKGRPTKRPRTDSASPLPLPSNLSPTN